MSALERRPLRIVHIDAEGGFSGGEVQVFLLIEGLAARGHANRLLCPPGSRAETEAQRRGLALGAVPMRNALDLAAVWRLARQIRAAHADIVHLHTGRAAWLGGAAARLTGVATVVTRRMDRPVRAGWRTRLVYERYAQRTVAISPAIAAQLVAGGVPADRIACIPSAVDMTRIRPSAERAVVRAAEDAALAEVVLLVVAALVRRKGIDVLLDSLVRLAARGLRPPLWIAGDGPERERLLAQVERSGLAGQVHFLGPRDDVGNLLGASDVVVLPSRREGLGVAALEAMAAGRPLVASAVGGLNEAVVDGRTGLLVPPEDAAALATALERLLRDAELRAKLGAEGPQRVAEGFLPEQMVAAYERLYREMLAG